jgi:hypothetical protein
MKKVFLIISGVWLLLSTVMGVNGQLASNNVMQSGRFVILSKTESEHATYAGRVDPPVIRNFLKTYKDVSDEKWIEVKEGFIAMFNYNDIDYQVAYTKKGSLIRTIRSYNEDKMSPELRHTVKSTWYDFEISRVHEVELPLNPIFYVVQLIGKKELINLGVYDGETEVLQRFNKSK